MAKKLTKRRTHKKLKQNGSRLSGKNRIRLNIAAVKSNTLKAVYDTQKTWQQNMARLGADSAENLEKAIRVPIQKEESAAEGEEATEQAAEEGAAADANKTRGKNSLYFWSLLCDG